MRIRTASAAVAVAAALAVPVLAPGAAGAAPMAGLTDDGRLVAFDSDRPSASAPVRVSGLPDGMRLLGIDMRPADGRLYGVATDNRVYAVDPATGAATAVSSLDQPLPAGQPLVVDFNPAADRLRVMGADGTNYRVDVDTGKVAVDGRLNHASGGGGGAGVRVTAGAYTNSVPGQQRPPSTALYNFDAASMAYTVQSPPNDGTQVTRGTGAPAVQAFDIRSTAVGADEGVALSGGMLHAVDLATGALSGGRAIEGLRGTLVDIAFLR
jgi:outer membrane protein assembly factor BamB